MATKNFKLVVQGDTDVQPLVSGAPRKSLANLARYLQGVAGGAHKGAVTVLCRNDCVAASGTVTISSGSGSITATINGVGISVTWGTSDTATATALAAAINASANALLANIVSASASGGVVTVSSIIPGVIGNCITLAASGTGATASGARLTGGSSTAFTLSF